MKTLSKTVSFVLDRETKNKYRFEEINDVGASPALKPFDQVTIGTLYVSKAVFEAKPRIIKVTIEELS